MGLRGGLFALEIVEVVTLELAWEGVAGTFVQISTLGGTKSFRDQLLLDRTSHSSIRIYEQTFWSGAFSLGLGLSPLSLDLGLVLVFPIKSWSWKFKP